MKDEGGITVSNELHELQERLWRWHDMRRKSGKEPCRANATGRCHRSDCCLRGLIATRSPASSQNKRRAHGD
jgi:hypothetical protein